MSIFTRYTRGKGLSYDPSYDRVVLNEEYFSSAPIAGVSEIIVGEGARSGADLHATRRIDIYSGSVIVGNVYAEEEINIIDKKTTKLNFGSIIVGDIYTKKLEVKKMTDEEVKKTVIYGNVIAEEAVINAPLLIRGNLLVKRDLEVKDDTFVLGRTRVGFGGVLKGRAYLENFGSIHIYIRGDLIIGDGVTTVAPIIAARGGSIRFLKKKGDTSKFKIRVLNFPCLICGEQDPLFCKHFKNDKCEIYDYLTTKDYATWEDRKFLAWYWRATPHMILQHFILEQIYKTSLKKIKEPLLESRSIAGIPFEQFYEYVLKESLKIATSKKKFENWLKKKFKAYIRSKGLEPAYCPECGFPNMPTRESVICVKCGSIFKAKKVVALPKVEEKPYEEKEIEEIKSKESEMETLVTEILGPIDKQEESSSLEGTERGEEAEKAIEDKMGDLDKIFSQFETEADDSKGEIRREKGKTKELDSDIDELMDYIFETEGKERGDEILE
ncbi:MAG: polymer-forming cytoskeletal protein [Candidatus Njordarchaeia archaeon]